MDINNLPVQGLADLPDRKNVATPAPRSLDTTGPAQASPAIQSSEEQTSEPARSVNRLTRPQASSTRLRVDEATQRIVTQFVDESNNVVRQIPVEELLKISAQFRRLEGLLFDKEG